jgi:hypothetical protein
MYSGQGQSVPQSGHGKEYWLAIGFMMPPVWRLVQTPEVLDDKSARGRAMSGLLRALHLGPPCKYGFPGRCTALFRAEAGAGRRARF